VRDLAEFFERPGEGPVRGVSTVAGLILLRLGRVPRVGDTVRLGNVDLRVESMDGRIIESVLVALRQGRGMAA
jgi:CBS domain containing-hemolysin-like protein